MLNNETQLLKDTFVQCMIDAAARDNRVMALDSDCAASSGFGAFAEAYPDRFYNIGIAEANMIGIAAGLSQTGKVPFVHAFAVFASRRACDQIFISGAYADANIRIVGTDPGVTASLNGGTHMPFEDMAVLRGIPNIKLLEVSDSTMLAGVFDELVDAHGVYYIRLKRKITPVIYDKPVPFAIGKAKLLRDGCDVTLVASGIMVAEALLASEALASEGIFARVIDSFTWKPMDAEAISSAARDTGAIVTCENHNIIGGLGSAVCEVVCRTYPCPVEMVGVQDQFGEVGTEDYLKSRFGLTAGDIAAAAKRAVARKK